MTQKQVRAVLGLPGRISRGSNDFGPYTVLRYPGLRITFQGNGAATSISTTARADRTAAGIGVGSTERQMRASVAGVRCTHTGGRICQLGRSLPGKVVTAFFLSRAGLVTSVLVGLVVD